MSADIISLEGKRVPKTPAIEAALEAAREADAESARIAALLRAVEPSPQDHAISAAMLLDMAATAFRALRQATGKSHWSLLAVDCERMGERAALYTAELSE